MAYQTFRVEITRYETRDDGPVSIEITAYIDRMPETDEVSVGQLGRVWRGVWASRLQYAGDFDTLAAALAAIGSAAGSSAPESSAVGSSASGCVGDQPGSGATA